MNYLEEARRCCESYLLQEIEFLNPSVVVLCGKKLIPFINKEFGLSLSDSTGNDAGTFERNGDQTFVVSPNFGFYRASIGYSRFSDTGEFFASIGQHLSE